MSPASNSGDASSGWLGGAAAKDGWGRRQGIHSPEDRRFVGLAAAALDDYLARNPVDATLAGDVRFDERLPDYSADGIAEQVRVLNRHLLALESINTLGLSRVNAVDLGILRKRLTARVYQLRTLAEPTWNPLWWSPGLALEPLFARPGVSPRAILARLRAMPEHLDSARHTLGSVPAPQLERELSNLSAVIDWLPGAVAATAAGHRRAASDLESALAAAMPALEEHRYWLAARRPRAVRDLRLGPRRYAEVLDVVLGSPWSAAEIKARAEAELAELAEQLRSLASRFLGKSVAARRLVPDALAVVADRFRLDAADLVPAAQRSVEAARAFTVEHRLVTVPDFAVSVVPMPAVRASGGAAFAETPGAYAGGEAATRITLAGPDPEWSAGRRDSFLREYNAVMLDALMAHQAYPGHALQEAHARAVVAPTAIRKIFPDQLFAEGWAVYAQDVMMREGYPGSVAEADPTAFALQQVKLRMRGAVNALLDVGYHTEGMDEPRARRLLATTAMAEEGEFVVKWRRVQLSAGVLTAYSVGHALVADVVAQVQQRNPHWPLRQVHDRVLSGGAVPPHAARDLLGLI
jgi:uncharacterized protein (DUF885 family)